MRLRHDTTARPLLAALAIAGLIIATLAWLHRRQAERIVPAHTYQLQPDRTNEWIGFGGSWKISDGSVQSDSYERGAKILAGSQHWGNYTVNTDIWYAGPAADMGVVIRTNDEREGVDSYNGYFVGVRSLDGTLVMGRANYSWIEVLPVTMPGGIHPFTWYRLRVTAYGCNLSASVTNLTTLQTAWIAFQEHFCLTNGRFGLRTLNAAKWRNISVEPATSSDYHALAQYATRVQHLKIENGPPWWTPWHVGMLFVGALALALLAQLGYFRFQNWKMQTITRERERLAHEIHDTMAQGFAGVGYQIQGIRSSIVRGEPLDSRTVADQMSVAYQLVRSCHEEASRTIAMLGSASPSVQNNLLRELTDTTRKTAGDKIQIAAELHGTPIPLNLHVADALLHIGREAISNALSHGNPTILKITLSYLDGSVELAVEDNGKGFECLLETVGFGILGMQKRARSLGSTLQISSVAGRGTQVRVIARLQDMSLRTGLLTILRRRFRSIAGKPITVRW